MLSFADTASSASATRAPAASGSSIRASVTPTPTSRIAQTSSTVIGRSHLAPSRQTTATPLSNRGAAAALGASHSPLSHPGMPAPTSVAALLAEIARDPNACNQLFQAIAPLALQQLSRTLPDMIQPAVLQGLQGPLAEMRDRVQGQERRLDQIAARQDEQQARQQPTVPGQRFRRQRMTPNDNQLNNELRDIALQACGGRRLIALSDDERRAARETALQELQTRVEDPATLRIARKKLLRKFKPAKSVRGVRRQLRRNTDTTKRIAALTQLQERARIEPTFATYEEGRDTLVRCISAVIEAIRLDPEGLLTDVESDDETVDPLSGHVLTGHKRTARDFTLRSPQIRSRMFTNIIRLSDAFLQASESSHLHAPRSDRGHAKPVKEEAMALLPPSFLLGHHAARNMELEDAIEAVVEQGGEFAEEYFPVGEEVEN